MDIKQKSFLLICLNKDKLLLMFEKENNLLNPIPFREPK